MHWRSVAPNIINGLMLEKWVFTEPEQGVFNYTDAEIFLDYAEGKLIRCHNLKFVDLFIFGFNGLLTALAAGTTNCHHGSPLATGQRKPSPPFSPTTSPT